MGVILPTGSSFPTTLISFTEKNVCILTITPVAFLFFCSIYSVFQLNILLLLIPKLFIFSIHLPGSLLHLEWQAILLYQVKSFVVVGISCTFSSFSRSLFILSDFESGAGTYVLEDKIFASVAGIRNDRPPPAGFGKKTIEVITKRPAVVVPQRDSTVLCRITSINNKLATALILAVETTFLPEPFRGIIMRRNVRETEVDTVEMYNWFRPGDIVRARVVCLLLFPIHSSVTIQSFPTSIGSSSYISFPLVIADHSFFQLLQLTWVLFLLPV